MKRGGRLQRRTPMRRSELKPRPKPAAVAARKAVERRRRVTGPSPATRALVHARAGGCCELCGVAVAHMPHSIHHRQPRGMGGTRAAAINSPANLLLVCGTGTAGCHGWIETHRASAYFIGWLVRRPLNPADVTVHVWSDAHDDNARQVRLTGWGTYEEAQSDA